MYAVTFVKRTVREAFCDLALVRCKGKELVVRSVVSRFCRRVRGVTLLELVVAVLCISIMAAIVIPLAFGTGVHCSVGSSSCNPWAWRRA